MKRAASTKRKHETSASALIRLAEQAMRIGQIVPFPDDAGHDHNDWSHPTAALDRSFDDFDFAVQKAMANVTLSHDDQEGFRVITGDRSTKHNLPPEPLLSNQHVRRRIYEILYDQLRPPFRNSGSKRRWFFGTIFTDVGNALERRPVIDMHRIRRDCRKAMAALELNAIGIVEFQAATYPQGGLGGTVMGHVHFIGYTDDPNLRVNAIVARIRRGTMLPSWLGAPPMRVKPIATLGALRSHCYYLCKSPARGHYHVRDDKKESGFRIIKAPAPAAAAFRLVELLAHLTFRDALFATGEGLQIKGNVLRALAAWQKPRTTNRKLPASKVLFERIRALMPYRISRDAFDIRFRLGERNELWTTAMLPLIEQVARRRPASRTGLPR